MLTSPKYVFSLFGLLTLVSTPIFVFGQQHSHKSPHGGSVQEADGLHVEFMIDKAGRPTVRFYDRSMKPLLRNDLEGKLTVKEHGADYAGTLTFSQDPKGGSVYKGEPIKGLKEWDSAVVSVKLNDRWIDIRFSNHSKGKAHH